MGEKLTAVLPTYMIFEERGPAERQSGIVGNCFFSSSGGMGSISGASSPRGSHTRARMGEAEILTGRALFESPRPTIDQAGLFGSGMDYAMIRRRSSYLGQSQRE